MLDGDACSFGYAMQGIVCDVEGYVDLVGQTTCETLEHCSASCQIYAVVHYVCI